MSAFKTAYTEIETIKCASCSMDFGITSDFKTRRKEDHATFYCPSGHTNYFPGQTEAEKLKVQLENEKRLHEWTKQREAQAKEDARTAKKSAAAYKGHLNSTRKRVAHGVCPCCSRTFQNVMRHMKTKHPEYGNDKP